MKKSREHYCEIRSTGWELDIDVLFTDCGEAIVMDPLHSYVYCPWCAKKLKFKRL